MSAYQHLGLFIVAVGAGILLGAALATIIRRRAGSQAQSSKEASPQQLKY
jgi:hypothetical protein